MNKNVVYYSIVVALAGFLFGFDTVVISGANLPIQELWHTSPWFHGIFIMSMALWGTVIGALFGGIPTNKFGRKNTLFWIGVLYFVSAVGSALAPDPYTFSIFRFIGGLGVGASTVAAPTYTSEIAEAKNRGQLVALYQFNIVLGILLAFISNYLLKGVGGANDWRFMVGAEAIPALIYTVMILGVPKSPRWLVLHKQNDAEALKILTKLSDPAAAQRSLEDIKEDERTTHEDKDNIFAKKYRLVLLLAFLIAAFNQLSGINFVLYYAPQILEKAGFGSSESLFSSISIGGVNLVFTMVGLYLIDRAGRKRLMLIGSIGYILSLAMIAVSFYTESSAIFKLIFILVFISSHAIGQGAVIWVFISEIFPNKVRAYGQSWGTGTHWVFAALITLVAPVLLADLDTWVIFVFFTIMMVLQLAFVLFLMPETKGVTLEDLRKKLIGSNN